MTAASAPHDEIIGSRQGWQFVPALVVAWLGLNVAVNGFLGAAIPKAVYLLGRADKDAHLALVTSIGGVVALIATPVCGRLSDRTRARWGMRKPWMLGGSVVIVLGAVVLAYSHSLVSLIVGWSLTQLGISAVAMGQHTLLADQVPARTRARVAAATGVASSLGAVLGAMIVGALPQDRQDLWFLVLAVIAAVLSALLCLAYEDACLTRTPPPLRGRDVLDTFWLNPLTYRDFAWAWMCRFLVTMAILTVSLYLYYLVIDTLHVDAAGASAIQARALLLFVATGLLTTTVASWISDRTGRRKPLVWASCFLTSVGLCVAMVSPGQVGFFIGFAIVGAGQGVFVAVDVAMMTELIPSADDAGKDLGIVALSYQLPQVLGPLAGTAAVSVMPGHDYSGLFVMTIVLCALGGLAVLPIKGVK